jgi:hypothetical protein
VVVLSLRAVRGWLRALPARCVAADYGDKAYAWTSATLKTDGSGDSPVV